MASSSFAILARIRTNKNELNTDSNNDINSNIDNKINNKITNLSSLIKKISPRAGFLIFKTSLAFT